MTAGNADMPEWSTRRLRISPDAMESRVGDETVILHLGNDTYFGLDALGTRIWEMLRDGHDLAAILDHIATAYQAARSTVEADLRLFIEDLIAHGLLEDS